MAQIEIQDGQMWRVALAHLEEQEQGLLKKLLRSGTLEDHLKQKVLRARELAKKLQKKLQPDQVEELVRLEILAPRNPNWHPEDWEELPEKEQKLLDEFRARFANL